MFLWEGRALDRGRAGCPLGLPPRPRRTRQHSPGILTHRPWDAYFAFSPDIALEVRSPSERRGHVSRKIRIYLAAGTAHVFDADPKKGNVTVYRPGQPPLVLSEQDVLEAEDVLPGFRLPVARLFE